MKIECYFCGRRLPDAESAITEGWVSEFYRASPEGLQNVTRPQSSWTASEGRSSALPLVTPLGPPSSSSRPVPSPLSPLTGAGARSTSPPASGPMIPAWPWHSPTASRWSAGIWPTNSRDTSIGERTARTPSTAAASTSASRHGLRWHGSWSMVIRCRAGRLTSGRAGGGPTREGEGLLPTLILAGSLRATTSATWRRAGCPESPCQGE